MATAGDPLYQQLADRLAAMIRARALRAGDRLPSVRSFSRQQRVSVPTALQAYATLEARGEIEARPRSGFFVRARAADTVPTPTTPRTRPRKTDGAELDPFVAVLCDQADPALVPLGAAVPGEDLLPVLALQRSLSTIARRSPATIARYHAAPGEYAYRQAIARQSLEWGCNLTPDDVIATIGATEALSLAIEVVSNPGDTIVVESPMYFGLVRMLRDLRRNVLPVPVDPTTGVDLDLLEGALRRTRVAACVLTPNFHNPTGSLMPDAHRRAVVELLDTAGVPLIEDDVYGDLQHAGPRPRCLKADDRTGNVILCGSFSKTLAPGLRAGYIVPGRFYEQVLAVKRARTLGGTMPMLAVADFLRNGGYERHLRTMRRKLAGRVMRMREAVAEAFPEGTAVSRPAGGFVLWCALPPGTDALRLFHRAKEAGISVAPGGMFGTGFENCVRLNCGYAFTPRIAAAIRTLGRLAR